MKQKKSFTLIELLITLFVFTAVVTIGLSAVTTSFVSGNLTSSDEKIINQDLNLVMQSITSKMATANDIVYLNRDQYIYGVGILQGIAGTVVDPPVWEPGGDQLQDILVIVSSTTDPNIKRCSYFFSNREKGDIRMLQKDCIGTDSPRELERSEFTDDTIISNKGIKITKFIFPDYKLLTKADIDNSSNKFAPYFKVQITAQDLKGEVTTTVESAFSLPYETVQKFY